MARRYASKMRVKITERALVQRINRALPKGQRLRVATSAQQPQLGRFYVTSAREILDHHTDLAKLGRNLDRLRPWEVLGD
jgi:hypothetical protein